MVVKTSQFENFEPKSQIILVKFSQVKNNFKTNFILQT